MQTIGTILKSLREKRGLMLRNVGRKTGIDESLLSRIENGKRLPTKNQVKVLSKFYKGETNQILIQWLSDKVVYEIKNEGFGMEALKIAEKKIRYTNPSLFSNTTSEKPITIESRRYIGSKAKLCQWILNTILKETEDVSSFIDLFAGTGSISKAAAKHFNIVLINDILESNYVIYKAFFQKSEWNKEKLENIIYYYNCITPESLNENYFSENFGDKFFEKNISKLIGFVRDDIDKNKKNLTEKEHNILLATLIYNIDRIANTVGHFEAYIKKQIRTQKLNFRLIEPIDLVDVQIFREDANMLARRVKADVAYIDPPYNSRQYSRFYHLYETLVKWDKPKLYGVALKPKPENSSLYCTVKAKNVFKDLINNLKTKYIAVSYNNTYNSKSHSSQNKIQLEQIESVLKSKGETKFVECSHKFFNSGKTEFDNHKEFLFITKVDE